MTATRPAPSAGRAACVAFVLLGAGVARADGAVQAFDAAGKSVDMARSHASIERTPPEREDAAGAPTPVDPDALRFVFV
jgi:hypothetical protein